MGRIVLWIGISLDGFIEGPDREIDWHRVDDELHRHMNEELAPMAGFISGRITHELMAEYWPTADQDPATPPIVAEFARIWRDKPKIVYSRTLAEAGWNTTIKREVVPDEVRALAAGADGDFTVGGPDLAAEFLRHDLVDVYRIYVHPVLIGRGRPLFRDPTVRRDLRLVDSRRFGNGVVLLHYERG